MLRASHSVYWCRDDVPVVVVMKAMGVESDQEVTQLVGSEGAYTALFAPSLQECKNLGIFTSQQALDWLGEPNALQPAFCFQVIHEEFLYSFTLCSFEMTSLPVSDV